VNRDILGVVLAGGRSTRFGSPKALALVGGERIIDRAIRAVSRISDDVVLIANDPALAAAVDLPARADVLPDAGALGGVWTGLLWAQERGRAGILAVACDMPFLSPALLSELVARAEPASGSLPDVVIPESGGRRAVEPLCAYYSVRCVPAVRAALDRSDYRLISFHEDVHVHRVAMEDVVRFGKPEQLFMNVNTPEEHVLAERLAESIR
jgi:molybdopterin-guanine dinucleotide biosynthesis protein A